MWLSSRARLKFPGGVSLSKGLARMAQTWVYVLTSATVTKVMANSQPSGGGGLCIL